MKEVFKRTITDFFVKDETYFDEGDRDFYQNIKQYEALLDPDLFSAKTVLEVGCGSGALANWVAAKFNANLVGIDLSHYATMQAQDKYEGNYAQADAEHLPFKEDAFDTIYLVDVLEHTVFVEKIFSEFFRVLKPHGKVLIANVAPDVRWETDLSFMEKVDLLNLWTKMKHVEPSKDNKYRTLVLNKTKVLRALKKAGFDILEQEGKILAQK